MAFSLKDLFPEQVLPPSDMGGRIAMPQAQPAPQGMGRGQLIAGILSDMLAGAQGKQGQFGQMMAQRGAQEQEEVKWQRNRQAEMADYGEKLRMAQQYQKAASPYRFEDNAGNQWERGEDGQNVRIFTDRTPKYIIQDGMQIPIANPYANEPTAPAAPPTIGEDIWNTGQPIGGAAPTSPRGFPYYR